MIVSGCRLRKHILTAVILLLRISVVVKHERRAGPGVDCWFPTFGQGFGSPEQFQLVTCTLDKPDFKLFILFKDAIIIENRNKSKEKISAISGENFPKIGRNSTVTPVVGLFYRGCKM